MNIEIVPDFSLSELLVKSGQAFYLSSKAQQLDGLFYIVDNGDTASIYASTSRFTLDGEFHFDSEIALESGSELPCVAVECILNQMPKGSDWKEGKLGA
tara:strand:+ start:65 stop:361 length:297 start_codon:yes stop_codon:yes gene_type:complete